MKNKEKFSCCGRVQSILEVYPDVVGKGEIISVKVGDDKEPTTRIVPTYQVKMLCQVCGNTYLTESVCPFKLPFTRKPLPDYLQDLVRPFLKCKNHPKYKGKTKPEYQCERCMHVYQQKNEKI